MSSFNILSAIKVNAAALGDAGYTEEAQPFIKALKSLFSDLDAALAHEKTAPTGETVEAAKETIPCVLSANSGNLSSFHVGQPVHTPDGDGEIIDITYVVEEPFVVKLSDSKPFNPHCACYKDTDLYPF